MTKRSVNEKQIIEENAEPPLTELQAAVKQVVDLMGGIGLTPEFQHAIQELMVVSAREALMMKEEISVYYPEQVFSPMPYMSYRCGNLWYKTLVLPGETVDDAYERAWKYLRKLVEQQFLAAREDFHNRVNNMSL